MLSCNTAEIATPMSLCPFSLEGHPNEQQNPSGINPFTDRHLPVCHEDEEHTSTSFSLVAYQQHKERKELLKNGNSSGRLSFLSTVQPN